MSTNKIVTRSIDEFMADFVPTYTPIMPLLLGKSQQYATEVGKINFKRLEAVGDLRSKMLGPKDTEMHQIMAKEGSKTFKKYFFGSQFIQSQLQDTQQYEDVLAQVLDEHNKQNDILLLTGEGSSDATVVNNGLFYSQDPNFVGKASYEVQKDGAGNYLADLYAKMVGIIEEANEIAGRKLVMYYGTTFLPVYNSLFLDNSVPFSKTIADAFPEVAFARMPSQITPSGVNGFHVINLDQIKLHYTSLAKLDDQGSNAEKKYLWANFIMGSSMVDVLALGGIIRQPITFEA